MTVVSLFLAMAAFILNMGWMRVILLLSTVPILLCLAHAVLGLILYLRATRSRVFDFMRLTHPLSYVLLQDVDDDEPGYIFFGLIDLTGGMASVADVLTPVVGLLLVGSLGATVVLTIQLWRTRPGS